MPAHLPPQLAQGYLAAVDTQRAQAQSVSLLALEKDSSVTFPGRERPNSSLVVVDALRPVVEAW